MRWLKWFLPLLFVGAPAGAGDRARPAAATPDCGTRIEGMASLLQPGAAVLLGEAHGTKEIPRLLGDLVCQGAGRGLGVSVALEMSSRNNSSFDTYLSSAGTAKDRELLLSAEEWRAEWPDGRTSVAMLEMLERLRVYWLRGWRIRVFGINGVGKGLDVPNDERMALNVRRIREEAPKDLILVLAGNNHTRVDAERSMGGHLRLSGLPLTSLNVVFSGGSLWTCRGPTCGAESVVTSTPEGKPSLDLTPQTPMGDGGWGEVSSAHPSFHGKLFIGRISASPPAGTPDAPAMPKPSL